MVTCARKPTGNLRTSTDSISSALSMISCVMRKAVDEILQLGRCDHHHRVGKSVERQRERHFASDVALSRAVRTLTAGNAQWQALLDDRRADRLS